MHERTRRPNSPFVNFRVFRGRLFLFLFLILPAALHAADGPSPAEAKLRESVRALTLQVRAAENEKAGIMAAQAEAEAKSAALTEEIEKLKKQTVAEKNAADLALAAQQTRLVEKEAEFAQSQKNLAEWKKAHIEVTGQFKKAIEIGNAKETERARLAARVIVLDRQVAEQRTRNAALYKTGIDVLSRYEKFGLGTALTSREPFIGTTRVKFENLIQDFSDQLADQKIKPEEAPAPPPSATAPAAQAKPEKPAAKKSRS